MIDMSSLHTHSDYAKALNNFNKPPLCRHNKFKDVHLKVSKNRCPICECPLDNSVTIDSNNGITTLKSTIDHYRPKNYYPMLECDHKNYLLMCTDCNGVYKDNHFPLHNSSPNKNLILSIMDNINNEKPLLVNPIYDNLLELFVLVFKYTPSGKKVLELKPKESSGYLYEKALETIKLFSLGDCEVNRNSSVNVQDCRITLLNSHFKKFYEFIEALEKKNINEAMSLIEKYKLKNYGFYIFIQKRQYQYLI